MAPRVLTAGQTSQVWVGGPQQQTPELLFETTDLLLEAPNWTLDGRSLVLNGDGVLWTLDASDPTSGLRQIDLRDAHHDGAVGKDRDGVDLRLRRQIGREGAARQGGKEECREAGGIEKGP